MEQTKPAFKPYLSSLGAFALSFGCAVGWGAFMMPGSTFLPIGGPLGTIIGIGVGALVMMLIALNYHILIKRFPGNGGTYTFTKHCFGYDHGFLAAWFMVLTYIAIIWANATALPLIARVLFGDAFRHVYLYSVAGFEVYLEELLLSIGALVIGALLCFRKKAASMTQIVMAIALFAGVVICFVWSAIANGGIHFDPVFSPKQRGFEGVITIFALAPWAFVGFESISHSSSESKFPLKRSFLIMAIAIASAGIAYTLLSLLALTALPEGVSSWSDYILNLPDDVIMSKPAFYGAFANMAMAGKILLGVAALCAVFTGIIGNYIALSRLGKSMSDDGLLPHPFSKLNKDGVPQNVILGILCISIILPFFGRTAISWIVDVTTVGATIAFAFTSACVFKLARQEKNKKHLVVAISGLIVSLLFAVVFLVPNILSVSTLSMQSYFILAAWGILGFVFFLIILRKDTNRNFGRSTIAWIVLLGLIIFASGVWMRQAGGDAIEAGKAQIEAEYASKLASAVSEEEIAALKDSLAQALNKVDQTLAISNFLMSFLIVAALVILFVIYSTIQKRQKQIEIEKAIAEDHSRAKTSFLSNMSHEIRTPMNAIIGLDSIALRDPDLSARTREHLEKIGASAKHLLGLINDILDMSRIESGRMTLKTEEFLFHDLIEQVNIIINGQCIDKGLQYDCVVSDDLSDYYVGDDMKLKQVLINILGNSVKFTNAPGNISLLVDQIKKDNFCYLRFQIKDTGIGMDKEFIPKIFDAFSQEDASTTNKYGGSGLGMAITKNFVEMMGGSIQVESEKGVGSTFIVTVKLTASNKEYVLENGRHLPQGLKALVVDDDEVACEHAASILDHLGIQVDSTLVPEKGIELARNAKDNGKPYSFIFLDLKMPHMDGFAVAKAIKEFSKNDSIIFLVTGYHHDDLSEEEATLIDDIVAKPLFKDTLLRTMIHTFDKRGGYEEKDEEIKDYHLEGKRVLMAEDVDANAEILADLLELEGIIVERAENGQVAIDKFIAHDMDYYDAILMDVRMPIKDGLAATREIRNIDRDDATRIPIIAMTANVFDEDVERSISSGMNAHLSKPIEPTKLYETLHRLIHEKSIA